jgi:signal recognition particle subunit SRP19
LAGVLRQAGKAIIWPANINSSRSRKEGRRIKRSLALDSPKLSEVFESAKKLGLNSEIVEKASRPSNWWDKTGYVIVDRAGRSKLRILVEIAQTIHKSRAKTPAKKS